MKSIFYNSKDKRLRVLFRIVVFLILTSLLATFLSLVTNDVGEVFEKIFLNFFVMIIVLLSIYLSGKFLDKREWSEFGITIRPTIQFFKGALLGSLLITIVFGIQFSLGWLTLSDIYFNKFSAYPFILIFIGQIFRYVCGSIFEEAISRGYLLKNLSEGLNGWLTKTQAVILSYIITSSLFGVLHLFNEGSNLLSTINLVLLGLLFGWSVLNTGKLHFAIGLHAFWNIFQNNIFGAANSGKKPVTSLFTFENSGNNLWTGGDFGPEGGLLCTITVGVALLFLMRSNILNKKLDQKILT